MILVLLCSCTHGNKKKCMYWKVLYINKCTWIKLSKYVVNNGIIEKYVKTCIYDKICKIKYS